MSISAEGVPGGRMDFIFLGEHPAIDFANTRIMAAGEPVELFSSWTDVMEWFFQAGLMDGEDMELPAATGARALEKVIDLRNAWTRLISEIISTGKVSEPFLARVNESLAMGSFHEVLRREGRKGFRIERSETALPGGNLALCLIARQIADFLAHGHLEHLRRCANTTSCVLYFYDKTKNHRRQWCSASTCGNRHKVAEFRKRQARAAG